MYILTSEGLAQGPLQYSLGEAAALCIHHAPTKGELCSFNSKKGGSTTAMYVPNAARGTNPVSLLVWIHGNLTCRGEGKDALSYVLSKAFPLAKQLGDSKRPFVLVAPTMNWTPTEWHALGSPKGMNEFLEEVRTWLITAGWSSAPSFGRLVLAGHSRAYVVLNALAKSVGDAQWSLGALDKLSDVWLLDTTYGKKNPTAPCMDWIKWAKAKGGANLG